MRVLKGIGILVGSFTLTLGLLACTDAQRSKVFSVGDSAEVSCFSGGKLIYSGTSTGKISSEENSDGYFFRDAADNRLKEISGNCVIAYE